MSRAEIIELFLREKILLEEQGKIVLAKKHYPKSSKINKNFENLLENYADAYPKSIKSGGRLVRRSTNSLRTKLKAFVNKRPDIPFEIILEAVTHYVRESKQRNYEYCISADYLILKNSSSELEAICDLILEGSLKASGEDNFITSLN